VDASCGWYVNIIRRRKVDLGRVEESARMARESWATGTLAWFDATTSATEQMITAYWRFMNESARLMMSMSVNTEQFPEALRQAQYDSSARQASSEGQQRQRSGTGPTGSTSSRE
jgi:hypothetical protein